MSIIQTMCKAYSWFEQSTALQRLLYGHYYLCFKVWIMQKWLRGARKLQYILHSYNDKPPLVLYYVLLHFIPIISDTIMINLNNMFLIHNLED